MTDQKPANRIYNAILWRDAVAVLTENPATTPAELSKKISCDKNLAFKLISYWRKQNPKDGKKA